MRRRVVLGLMLASLAGCGGELAKPEGPALPRVGDKAIIANGADLWKRPDALKRADEGLEAGEADPSHPRHAEFEANDAMRIGLVSAGTLVEVLEIGDGYVAIDELRSPFDRPLRHGYVAPWWKSTRK